jgi:hypothetical protein
MAGEEADRVCGDFCGIAGDLFGEFFTNDDC